MLVFCFPHPLIAKPPQWPHAVSWQHTALVPSLATKHNAPSCSIDSHASSLLQNSIMKNQSDTSEIHNGSNTEQGTSSVGGECSERVPSCAQEEMGKEAKAQASGVRGTGKTMAIRSQETRRSNSAERKSVRTQTEKRDYFTGLRTCNIHRKSERHKRHGSE